MVGQLTRKVNQQVAYARTLITLSSTETANQGAVLNGAVLNGAVLNGALLQLEQAVVWYVAELQVPAKSRTGVMPLVSIPDALSRAASSSEVSSTHLQELLGLQKQTSSWLFQLIAACDFRQSWAAKDELKNPFFDSDALATSNGKSLGAKGQDALLIPVVSSAEVQVTPELLFAWCDGLQELMLRQRSDNLEY